MKNREARGPAVLVSVLVLAALPLTAAAADDPASLSKRVDDLEKQVRDASEWRRAESYAHLAGYGAVTYVNTRETGVNDNFGMVRFNPIFHYQYRDLVMLESELELEVTSTGETETKLEYLTVDLFLNDYMALMAGKFLSPLGQFRQNLHPLWVNKLASAPAGFGEEQAAPMGEVGLQMRGGVPLGTARLNYALYLGNGPVLEADGGEIEAVMADGMTGDPDGGKVGGGRIGIVPLPGLEAGISAAAGKTTVSRDMGAAVVGDPKRDYRAAGADISYTRSGFKFLSEFIQQKVGEAAGSVAPEKAEWEAWYVQVSYQIPQTKWEGVLRYGDYDSPHASQDQKQTAVGINYLFAAQVVVKVTYEINDGQEGAASDSNRLLAQIAYGF